MFERFTERARRVVTLAQQEARDLNHNYIGTEHLLLGLIREGEGVAAQALESLGISLAVVRQRVLDEIGEGQHVPSGHIPFTPRAKKTLELSLRESLQLGHDYIGTEHLLLGLIREGDGTAARVLGKLGVELNLVRQKVIEVLQSRPSGRPVEPVRAGQRVRVARREWAVPPELEARFDAVETRLETIERRIGTGPDTRDLDEQIKQFLVEREAAIDAQEFEEAAALRNRERQLIDEKAALLEQWEAEYPGLTSLAEQCRDLGSEIDRLRTLLREHGIDPA